MTDNFNAIGQPGASSPDCGCSGTPCLGCPPFDLDGNGTGSAPTTLDITMQQWGDTDDESFSWMNGTWPVTLQGGLQSTLASLGDLTTDTDQVCCWWTNAAVPGDFDDNETIDDIAPRIDVFIGSKNPLAGNWATPALKANHNYTDLSPSASPYWNQPPWAINSPVYDPIYQIVLGSVSVRTGDLILLNIRYIPSATSDAMWERDPTTGLIGGVGDLVGNDYKRVGLSYESSSGYALETWYARNAFPDASNLITAILVPGAVTTTVPNADDGVPPLISDPVLYSIGGINASVSIWSGVGDFDVVAATNVSSDGHVTPTGLTTRAANELLILVADIDGTDTFSPTSGYSIVAAQNSLAVYSKNVTSIQSGISATVTGTGNHAWNGLLLGFRAKAAPLYVTVMISGNLYVWQYGTYSAWPLSFGFCPLPDEGGFITGVGLQVGSDGTTPLVVANGCCPSNQEVVIAASGATFDRFVGDGGDEGTGVILYGWDNGGFPPETINDFNFGKVFISSLSCGSVQPGPCCPDGFPKGFEADLSNLKITNNSTSIDYPVNPGLPNVFDMQGNVSGHHTRDTSNQPQGSNGIQQIPIFALDCGINDNLLAPPQPNLAPYLRGDYCLSGCCASEKSSESRDESDAFGVTYGINIIIGRNAPAYNVNGGEPSGPYYFHAWVWADTLIGGLTGSRKGATIVFEFGTPFILSTDPAVPGGFAPLGDGSDTTIALCDDVDMSVPLIANTTLAIPGTTDTYTLHGTFHLTSNPGGNGSCGSSNPVIFDVVDCCTGARTTIQADQASNGAYLRPVIGETVLLNNPADSTTFCGTIAAATSPTATAVLIKAILDDCSDCLNNLSCCCDTPIDYITVTTPSIKIHQNAPCSNAFAILGSATKIIHLKSGACFFDPFNRASSSFVYSNTTLTPPSPSFSCFSTTNPISLGAYLNDCKITITLALWSNGGTAIAAFSWTGDLPSPCDSGPITLTLDVPAFDGSVNISGITDEDGVPLFVDGAVNPLCATATAVASITLQTCGV